mgnify:CR=1 FL=1
MAQAGGKDKEGATGLSDFLDGLTKDDKPRAINLRKAGSAWLGSRERLWGILDFNKPAATRVCLESVRRHVKVPHKVIYYHNGPADYPRAFLDVATTFKDLDAYRRSVAFAADMYDAVATWPKVDLWTTGVQLLRAADSVDTRPESKIPHFVLV